MKSEEEFDLINWLKTCTLPLSIALVASACSVVWNPAPVRAGFTDFITRSGDTLMDGTTPFRFIGTNEPLLERAWTDPKEIEDAIRAASQSGIQVLRLYPFEVKMASDPEGTFRHVMGPGDYNEKAFKLFDRILQLANDHNIRLIVPFVDSHNYIGGVADWAAFRGKTGSEFYTDAVVKQDFKDFITYVVNRTNTYTGTKYKDDKSILAWQLGNELYSTDSWVTEMAAHVKAVDPNHLLSDGGYVRAQGIRPNAVNNVNIDIIDPHIYKYHLVDMATQLASWRNATLGKKALIIGEFGDYTPTEVEQLLDTVQTNGTAGAMYWGSMHHHRMGGWHFPYLNGWSYLRYPGFASAANESAITEIMRDRAHSIQGLSTPAWPAPAAPVLFPSDSVHALSWLGVAGASSYDVERAASASGPWTVVGTSITDDMTTPRHHTWSAALFDDASAAAGSSYYYRIRAKNLDNVYSPYSNVSGPVKANSVIIVDNSDGGPAYAESGTWGSSSLPGSYGGTSRWSSTAGSTARWTPNLPAAGYYNVYVRYPLHDTSSPNAEYTVVHGGGSNTVYADQKVLATSTGQWRKIDSAYFNAGTSGYVRLTAAASSGNHRADAVMFEPIAFGDGFQSGTAAQWTPLSGSWSVAHDLTPVLKQSAAGIAETSAAGTNYSDVSVTAALKAYENDASKVATAGLVARANADFTSMYTLRLNYQANKVQLYKKVSGVWTKLAETDLLASPGTWYLLRLELKGSSIKGYVNGIQTISASDGSLTSGSVGLRTSDLTSVFDNFQVVTP
ncbi:golvesin C-terminal-like domain-containing protein [Paenibacillus puerhi]|uniref:golvesin C-terminal-like domain-containing protein n=1 Tax=Paenibacillus puerhi TaxID=2692622 RepID=UPI001F1EB54F|nr:cellulase family glycosylhydrolase [Paenibacillus puerhi]